MKRFLKYIALFFLPIVLVMLPFFIGDPFMILRHYDRYYPENGKPLYINNNRSYVSTRMYIQNKDSLQYDSFIFGSSRSGYYLVEDWQKYIGDSTHCFHFDGYGEPLYLVHKKVLFVDGKSPMRHVLLPIDEEMLRQTKPLNGPIWVSPIEIENHDQFNSFFGEHIRGYLTPKFWLAYTNLLFLDKVRPYMIEWGIVDTIGSYYVSGINERYPYLESSAYADSLYSPSQVEAFITCQQAAKTQYDPLIRDEQKRMLEEIKDVLVRNKSEYKIVINPMWNQTKLADEDMACLENLFGEHLFDFSGKTIFTTDYHNYSNTTHFSDRVAATIMNIMYESDTIRQRQMMDSIYIREEK